MNFSTGLVHILNDDPSNITILNIPRSYPRGVVAQVNLDGNIYAFVGGRSNDAVPVHIPDAGLESVATGCILWHFFQLV